MAEWARCPVWLYEDPNVSDRAIRLFLILERMVTATRAQAWPSRAAIAKTLGCHTGSIRKWLAELEAVGAVVRVRRFAPDGAETDGGYELHYEPPTTLVDVPSTTGGGAPVGAGGARRPPRKSAATGAPLPMEEKDHLGANAPRATTPGQHAKRIIDAVCAARDADGSPRPVNIKAAVVMLTRVLEAGYDPAAVLAAAMVVPTITVGTLEVQLRKGASSHRPASGGAVADRVAARLADRQSAAKGGSS